MRKRIVFLVMVLCLSASIAQADLVNFDDGVAWNSVGSFYSTLGINFSNTVWTDNFVGTIYAYGQATAPLSIRDEGTQGFNSSLDPVVITFDIPQKNVSILAVNVGLSGAKIDAYDSIIGGSLVDSSEALGTTLKGEIHFSGALTEHEEFLLEVTAPNILRVELYRPYNVPADGVHYDNLSFTPVPTPSAVLLGMIGLSVAGSKLRKHA